MINKRVMRQLRQFVRMFMRRNLEPLAADTDVTTARWADECSLPRYKVDSYIKALLDNYDYVDFNNRTADGFIKDEDYVEPKVPRGIHSRGAQFKAKTGPIFHAIEKSVFSQLSRYFIKYLPVCDRPKRLMELARPGSLYLGTDYSKYEATISAELMKACELQLYSYMTKNLDRLEFIRLIYGTLPEVNFIRYGHVAQANVTATRMSGDMCTSLGNGFTNLMVFLFNCYRVGIDPESVEGVVEGDDGLFRMDRDVLKASMFEELGMIIKITKSTDIGRIGFCSLFFEPSKPENVSDPFELLAKFGWTKSNMRHAKPNKLVGLLRAKAFSLAYELPGCPVAAALARYALRVTRGTKARFDTCDGRPDYWQRVKGLSSTELDPKQEARLYEPIPPNTRQLVSDLFGMSPALQIELEQMLDQKTDISPIDSHSALLAMPDCWKEDWTAYVLTRGAGELHSVVW